MRAERVIITTEPFVSIQQPMWGGRGEWPASWVDHPGRCTTQPSVVLFRRQFTAEENATVRLHVSADNRYRLYLDGQPLGRGPERGSQARWYFESYDVEITAGDHTLVALNWWLGDDAPYAQLSVRPAFLLAAEGAWQELLSTGIAAWESSLVAGVEFLPGGVMWGPGAKVRIVGEEYPWGWESGTVGEWQPVATLALAASALLKNNYRPNWLLTPATLPPMKEEERTLGTLRYLADGDTPYPVCSAHHLAAEAGDWHAMLAGTGEVTIPPHTSRRAIIDLDNYYCAYPCLRVAGGKGARIGLQWAEALYEQPEYLSKGNRNEVEGKYFLGAGDEFLPDGGDDRTFSTLWWETGRYLELMVTTTEAPVTLHGLTFLETGYPLTMETTFNAADTRLAEVIPIGLRCLQMCAHETYMDCPYYEQLMYVGDTRLEVLTTYTLTRDDRLPRKALATFDASRLPSGLTRSHFPGKLTQIIPPFSLWWVCMVHDYWRWRDEHAFVRGFLPGVRAVMEAFRALVGDDDLLAAPLGWNFTDWVPTWENGIPPTAETAPSGILNLHFALTLTYKAELEAFFGEELLAARDRALAARLADAVMKHFWDEERGVIADDLGRQAFSEHAQCLALLSGLLPSAQATRIATGLLTTPNLAQTTIYFSHYLFETLYQLGCGEQLLARFAPWFNLTAQGFTTTFESPEPSRSDCHAWGAHPIYHYFASILGIRPGSAGFQTVKIAPQLGTLSWAEGRMVHPVGNIDIALRQIDSQTMRASIKLPGVGGVFVWKGQEHLLQSGDNEVLIARSLE